VFGHHPVYPRRKFKFENWLAFVMFDNFGFSEFVTPFTLGGHNFLIFNSLLTILNVSDEPRGRVQVLFGHQKKQRSSPLHSRLA
jgi:hypothetical protein